MFPWESARLRQNKLSFAPGDWDGWSVEPDNARYQAKPGLSPADFPRLKVKWAFGFPADTGHSPNLPLWAGAYSWAAPAGRCSHWMQPLVARIGVSRLT